MVIRSLAVAGLASALTVMVLSVPPSAAAPRKPYAQCMTDDGYGRFRLCSALSTSGSIRIGAQGRSA